MKRKRASNRGFPGRHTLEQWLELSFHVRRDLAQRAQCEFLLGLCDQLCEHKRCRRHRICCGDTPVSCAQQLWQRLARGRRTPEFKVLGHEHYRIGELAMLQGPDRAAPMDRDRAKKKRQPRQGMVRSEPARPLASPTGSTSGSPREAKMDSEEASSLWEIIQSGRPRER